MYVYFGIPASSIKGFFVFVLLLLFLFLGDTDWMLQGQNEMCFNAEKPIAFVCSMADPVSWPDFIFFILSLNIYNCSQVPVLLHIAHNIIFLHSAIFSFLFFTHVCLDVISVKG